jgi:hypothetical protein
MATYAIAQYFVDFGVIMSALEVLPMRITGLLALLLFFLIVFFAAPAASYAQNAKASAAPAEAKNDVAIPEDNAPPEIDRPIVVVQPFLEHGGDMVFREYSRDDTCYTMRTYVMAREDKDSDATRTVRYRKCLPGWKVDLKNAIAPVKSGLKP